MTNYSVFVKKKKKKGGLSKNVKYAFKGSQTENWFND